LDLIAGLLTVSGEETEANNGNPTEKRMGVSSHPLQGQFMCIRQRSTDTE